MHAIMNYFTLLISATFLIFSSCECSKTIQNAQNIEQAGQLALTSGKVSHMYRATGCKTVIIVSGFTEPLTLIPKDELPVKLDKDGLEILFNYRLLKMPNPKGCSVGMPAELSDVSIK